MTSPEKPERVYYPQIDVLRFGAFLMVFIQHNPVIQGSKLSAYVKNTGAYGVDLFFIISAFLLFDLLYKEHERFGRIDVQYFFVRRILRIWPLYFFALAVLCLCSIYLEHKTPDLPRLAGLALFLDNFNGFSGADYAPLYAGSHLWTISLEEQFYLFVPLITLLLIQFRPRGAFVFLVVLFLFSLAARAMFLGVGVKYPPGVWVMHIARMEPFVLGFAVAYVYNRYGITKPMAFAGLAVFAAIVTLTFTLQDPPFNFLYPYSRWAVATAAIALTGLFVFVLSQQNAMKYLFQNRPLVFLGRISYGLYVWHVLGFKLYEKYFVFLHDGKFERQVSVNVWLWRVLIGLAITILISVISYFVLEKPFLSLKKRFTLVANR